MPRFVFLSSLGLTVAITLAACSGAGAAPSATPATSAAASTAPVASMAAGATTRINANTASQAELEASFTAAGIPNAAKWAREVTEYRPYPADPTWARLRQELSKYNISQAVFDQIIAVLEV
jgi:hypothetical protein